MKTRHFIFALVLLVLPLLVFSGEEEVARALLKKGDEALQKNDVTRAIELYKKALKECYNLPEAYFKLGNGYLKRGDKRKARKYFEECIKLIKETPKPPPSLQNLLKEANSQLNTLDKNKQELVSLEKKYITDLLTLAKKTLKKDIPLTETILKAILSLEPTNPDASKLSQELKQLRVFESWQPMFNGEDFTNWEPEGPSFWTVENNILVCDPKNQAPVNRRKKLTLEKVYKILMEFKVDEFYSEGGRHGCVGVILGFKGTQGDMTALSIFEDETKLLGFKKGDGTDIKDGTVPDNFNMSDWNTLVLDVSYTTLRCYLNDILVLEYRADEEDFFWGESGLWIQRAKTQIRKMQYLKQ